MCQVSGVRCQVSGVTYNFYFFIYLIFLQNGGACRGRVCNQRGLPRLVYSFINKFFYGREDTQGEQLPTNAISVILKQTELVEKVTSLNITSLSRSTWSQSIAENICDKCHNNSRQKKRNIHINTELGVEWKLFILYYQA